MSGQHRLGHREFRPDVAAPPPTTDGQILDTASALVRIGLAALAGILLLVSQDQVGDLVTEGIPTLWGALLAVAVVASLVQVLLRGRFRKGELLAEALVTGVLVGAVPAAAWSLQLYALAPAMLAGFWLKPVRAMLLSWIAPMVAAMVSLVAPFSDPWSLWQALSWIVVSSLAAVGSALLTYYREDADGDAEAYAIAVGLLQQLDRLSRRLPAGLDSGTVASNALARLSGAYPAERACLVLQPPTDGQASGLLIGDAKVVSVVPAATWSRVVRTGAPQLADSQGPEARTSLLLLPLLAQGRTEAVAILARSQGRFRHSDVRHAQRLLHGAGLQIAASTLFTEVRETAVAEERSRVGAQIHDGIAQDLAGLAYSLDAIAMTSTDPSQSREISQAGDEVRSLVEELRVSIFTLRTDLGTDERLGTALAGFARHVAERSGMRIHVDIDDSAGYVHPGAGHELMRIAQEAITNARKHSQATTLWVRLRVAPSGVTLVVADDGLGVGQRPTDGGGSGTSIMRDRARRLGGTVAIGDRREGGTEVLVRVGGQCVSPWPFATSDLAEMPVTLDERFALPDELAVH